MTKDNIKISADAFDAEYIKTISQDPKIERVHIGCIESNYDAIRKSKGIKNVVVHILINRIDSIEKLKSQLVKYGVKKILLINGNPHPEPYEHDFIEIIKHLKPIVDVFVAGYPTKVFYIQTEQHIKTQINILKEKIDAGAKEIYLQGTYNINKLSRFNQTLLDNNLLVPINYGISPNITFKQTFNILKEIIQPISLFLNLKNLDFLIRLLRTNNNRSANFYSKLKNELFFRKMDGIHLTTLDSDMSSLIYSIYHVKSFQENSKNTSFVLFNNSEILQQT